MSRLIDSLRSAPPNRLARIVQRYRFSPDSLSRLDSTTQLARHILSHGELRRWEKWDARQRQIVTAVADAGGQLQVDAIPKESEELGDAAILFQVQTRPGAALIMPAAILLSLAPWPREGRATLRSLLHASSSETRKVLAREWHAVTSRVHAMLTLEDIFLRMRTSLEEMFLELTPEDRALLDGIRELGGEVEQDELLELEGQVRRSRASAPPSRRTASVALERRGFLFACYPRRFVIPLEVSSLLARERGNRASPLPTDDAEPERARYSVDPTGAVLFLSTRALQLERVMKTDAGIPRSWVRQCATELALEPLACGLLAALSRSLGLWLERPFRSPSLQDLALSLFEEWRDARTWDESLPERELLRYRSDQRSTPTYLVRDLVLGALPLHAQKWTTWSAFERHLERDPRFPVILRRFERMRGAAVVAPLPVARVIVEESLFSLGIVDLGTTASDDRPSYLRLSARSSRWLMGAGMPERDLPSASWQGLRFVPQPSSSTSFLPQLGPFGEPEVRGETFSLLFSKSTLERALLAGRDLHRLEAPGMDVPDLPEALGTLVSNALRETARATLVGSSGFLWVREEGIRRELLTRRETRSLFVDPSPAEGLLVAPNIRIEDLRRAALLVGLRIVGHGVNFVVEDPRHVH